MNRIVDRPDTVRALAQVDICRFLLQAGADLYHEDVTHSYVEHGSVPK